MPIYEYHCRECDNRFERLVSMSTKDTDVECPACQKKDVERVLSVFAARAGAGPASAGRASCSTSFGGG